jgi:hypothetical protein
VIAGENSEASGVDREAFVESEFGGKEGDGSGQSWEVSGGPCCACLQVVVLAFSGQLQLLD